VTPILVRPVREQLEHDRVIRLLQLRWKRKYEVGINPGAEQVSPVAFGENVLYPDVVLTPPGKGKKPEIVIEVETGESVNNLEALAEWVRLARGKAEFHLYVPTGSVDAARRLCTGHNIPVAEICSFHPVGEQMRFTTVYKAPPRTRPAPKRTAPAGSAKKRPAAARPTKQKPAAGRAKKRAAAPRPRPAKKSGARPAKAREKR